VTRPSGRGFREAAEIVEHHHGRPYGLWGLFLHIASWCAVGKPRFVPDDRTDEAVRAEKKRTRQARTPQPVPSTVGRDAGGGSVACHKLRAAMLSAGSTLVSPRERVEALRA
jgi:hypothetical protein